MEVSHIRTVLEALKSNFITVPIITNQYEETYAMNVYDCVLRNPFHDLDDFTKECHEVNQKMQINPSKIVQLPAAVPKSTPSEVYPLRSLLDCVQSVKSPEKYRMSTKLDLMQVLTDFKDYIANTLLKDLDITKFKLTKKKIKEDLNTIQTNIDMVTVNDLQDLAKSLLVVASRNLKYNVEVTGDINLMIPYKEAGDNILRMNLTKGHFVVV